MAVWLIRAGRDGEYEQSFLDERRSYLTWSNLNYDLGKMEERTELRTLMEEVYPDAGKNKITNHLGQIWAFVTKINPGDWVVMPSKIKRVIHIGKVKGGYTHNPDGESPYFHFRDVEWVKQDIPRTNFDQDLLYSFGAFMSICEIKRHDAEKRIDAMSKNGWRSAGPTFISAEENESEDEVPDEISSSHNLEEIARDSISRQIIARFKGHGMERLVASILEAQGYVTHRSPTGADKGVDILAAPAPMGFGDPKICVQVKSSDSSLDRPTLDQLIGTMQNMNAQYGLLVSWGGFKSSVDKEKASQFFKVRLWDQNDLIDNFLTHYDELDDEIRAEIPLKRIWTLSVGD